MVFLYDNKVSRTTFLQPLWLPPKYLDWQGLAYKLAKWTWIPVNNFNNSNTNNSTMSCKTSRFFRQPFYSPCEWLYSTLTDKGLLKSLPTGLEGLSQGPSISLGLCKMSFLMPWSEGDHLFFLLDMLWLPLFSVELLVWSYCPRCRDTGVSMTPQALQGHRVTGTGPQAHWSMEYYTELCIWPTQTGLHLGLSVTRSKITAAAPTDLVAT